MAARGTRPALRSKRFWDFAAGQGTWYTATGFDETSASAGYFASGFREVDDFLELFGLRVNHTDHLLELGSGAGRMTHRLSDRAGSVVAADISPKMLELAATYLSDRTNVQYVELDGDGRLPFDDASFDAVFSYLMLPHVESRRTQLRYLRESVRVVRPGGWCLLQFRHPTALTIAKEWVGHLANVVRRKRTLHPSWRGSHLSESAVRALHSDRVRVDVLHHTDRQSWAVIRKQPAARR